MNTNLYLDLEKKKKNSRKRVGGGGVEGCTFVLHSKKTNKTGKLSLYRFLSGTSIARKCRRHEDQRTMNKIVTSKKVLEHLI